MSIDAAREFSQERREALWREISEGLPAEAPRAPEFAAVGRKQFATRPLALFAMALLLCVSIASIANLWSGELILEDVAPPLSAWEKGLIALDNPGVSVPLGSVLNQEEILRVSGAKAALPGQLIVSGLGRVSTDVPGEYSLQITLRDEEKIALGSVFLTLTVEES